MVREQTVMVEGVSCQVTISDEEEALLAAYAAGGAVVGIWDETKNGISLRPAEYLIQSIEDADEEFLERVVRRRKGLPWIIKRTKRLLIRELILDDWKWVKEVRQGDGGRIFTDREALSFYISCQYQFYEYGIWALLDQETGDFVGTAGLTGLEWTGKPPYPERETERPGTKDAGFREDGPLLELGYYVRPCYRRQGYAKEACRAILSHAAENWTNRVFARIRADNSPSIHLAEGLGFCVIDEEDNGEKKHWLLYEVYCS